ncbi:MAG: ssDNA-binding domain-containing protein [Firmicutes bacterium]|nr:ssDNA-binding domain-containing protein [Bacillota bacterium]
MNPETVRERVQALHRRLEEGIARLQTAGEWQRYLKVQARFHRYSFANTLLILTQRPDATLVAGYRAWQELGRHVRRGEHGIVILAPVVVRSRANEESLPALRAATVSDEESREEEGGHPDLSSRDERVIRFRPVYVFDVSQTEGKPLPEPPVQTLRGHSKAAERLYRALLRMAAAEGIRVAETSELGGAHGVWRPQEREILLLASDPPDQRAKTLAHELAHAWLHPAGYPYEQNRARAETEAESVAYVVSAARGLDTSRYSFGYVLGWAQDPKLVRESGERIQATARRMIDRLEELEHRWEQVERTHAGLGNPRGEREEALALER